MKNPTLILLFGLLWTVPQIGKAQTSITQNTAPYNVTNILSTGVNSFYTDWTFVWPASAKSATAQFERYDSLNTNTWLLHQYVQLNPWENGVVVIHLEDNLPNCLTIALRVRLEVQFYTAPPIVIYAPYVYVPFYNGCNTQGVEELFAHGEQYRLITYDYQGRKIGDQIVSELPHSSNEIVLYQLISIKNNQIVRTGKLPVLKKF